MSLSLHDQVESFLCKSMYISFAIESKEAVISFLFDKDGFDTFKEAQNYKNLRRYFKGKRVKLVIVTNPEGEKSSISLVDIHSGDALNLEGPKFVNGNIHKFFEAKVPENTTFKLTIVGKSRDNSTMLIPAELATHKPLEIHGYSVTDTRSA